MPLADALGEFSPPAFRSSPHEITMKLYPRILLLAGLAAAALSHAERLPVLQQIDLPHPYYYREMYLPQLTSGPSSLAWSPDFERTHLLHGRLAVAPEARGQRPPRSS